MYDKAIEVLKKFNSCGYDASIVGGYPRDMLLGIEPKDIDICTNATPKEIMEIFDTHAHYADSAFDEDREQLLSELPGKGVKLVMLAASGLDDSRENVLLAQKYGYIFASVGVHPESVDDTPADYIETLRKLIASEPKIKAVG